MVVCCSGNVNGTSAMYRYGFCKMVGLGGRCRRVCDRAGRSAMRIEAKSKAEETLQGMSLGDCVVGTPACGGPYGD